MLEKKLLEEVKRFNAINKYAKKMIMEQDVPPPTPETEVPAPDATAEVPPTPDAGATDPNATAEVPPITDAGTTPMDTDTTEEIDITDLVNMTKNIKKDIDSNKQDHGAVIAKMDDVFTKLTDLEAKLGEMDALMNKIDNLGQQVEKMKPETPQEKLEMRSLDSYPFNEKPQEFFAHKQGEMQASGKNEYVLRKDEIQNYSKDTIRSSFNPEQQEDEFKY